MRKLFSLISYLDLIHYMLLHKYAEAKYFVSDLQHNEREVHWQYYLLSQQCLKDRTDTSIKSCWML